MVVVLREQPGSLGRGHGGHHRWAAHHATRGPQVGNFEALPPARDRRSVPGKHHHQEAKFDLTVTGLVITGNEHDSLIR